MVYSNILLTIGSVVCSELFGLFRDFFIAFWEVLIGTKRQYTESTIFIKATKQKVWSAFWSSAHLNCSIPIDYNIKTVSDDEKLYQVSVSVEGVHQSSYIQVLQMRDEEAFVADRYYDSCEYELGFKQQFALNLIPSESGEGTVVNQFNFTQDQTFLERLATSFETRWMLRAFKEHCEEKKMQCDEDDAPTLDASDAFWAITSSAFLFLACSFSYDVSLAIFILLVLVCHEFGHVLALNLLGIKIPGMFMLPFMGSSAIAQIKFKSAFNEAITVLMGASMSLLPTGITFLMYILTGDAMLGVAASIFAFINILSLAPLPPFDGECIANILIRSAKAHDICAAFYTIAFMGFYIALCYGYVAFAFVGIVMCALTIKSVYELMSEIMVIEENDDNEQQILEEGAKQIVYLTFFITLGLYAWVLVSTLSDQKVSQILGLI